MDNKSQNSILLSQNFLKSKSLVNKLIEKSNISKEDLVIEIGPGKGIITQILLNKAKAVIAIEKDKDLFQSLKEKLKENNNLTLYNSDFLDFELPSGIYKVFSNIPFSITSDITRKLLESQNSPLESYIIMQTEAAYKFSGKPYVNETQFSILHKVDYSFKIIHRFSKNDFYPYPQVDSVLLKISKLQKPHLNKSEYLQFKDFIIYALNRRKGNIKVGLGKIFTYNQLKRLSGDLKFNLSNTPTDLSFEQWLSIFKFYIIALNSKQININKK